jgi:peptidoglycan-associated lipoprotein
MRAQFLRWITAAAALAGVVTVSGCGGSQPPPPEPEMAATPPPSLPQLVEPSVRDEGTTSVAHDVPALEPIHFDFNEYRILPEARTALEKVSVVMKENPHWTLLLEGHCDERGTDAYNLALGENRAQAAKRYLISLGVGEQRFATVSYGEERPADPGSSEEAWARNRRAEFRLRVPGS